MQVRQCEKKTGHQAHFRGIHVVGMEKVKNLQKPESCHLGFTENVCSSPKHYLNVKIRDEICYRKEKKNSQNAPSSDQVEVDASHCSHGHCLAVTSSLQELAAYCSGTL